MLGCGLLILCGIQFVGVVVCSLIVLIFVSILCRGNCLRLVWVLVARDLLFFGVFGVVGLALGFVMVVFADSVVV